MDRDALKALQAPLKHRFQSEPESAIARLRVVGTVDFQSVGCSIALLAHDGSRITAGLHPMAGGDGSAACSGDMLLQALATCAGTTLAAVAISMGLTIRAAEVEVIGTMDFRGTLGVDKSVPVGFSHIEILFHVQSDAISDQIEKLVQLTERYCVVYQTLSKGVAMSSRRV
jgi:uncharacterized OsmC-like protein